MSNDQSKTIAEWEREKGVMFLDARKHPVNKKVTEDEFMEILQTSEGEYRGVTHDDREKWLKDNGYDVTRANMLDPDLLPKSEK